MQLLLSLLDSRWNLETCQSLPQWRANGGVTTGRNEFQRVFFPREK